jgi:hypothetical protein
MRPAFGFDFEDLHRLFIYIFRMGWRCRADAAGNTRQRDAWVDEDDDVVARVSCKLPVSFAKMTLPRTTWTIGSHIIDLFVPPHFGS